MENVFLFTGEETYLLRQKINAWKEAFKKKHGDINLNTIDATEMSLGEVMADLSAAPFLGEKRLVVIEGLPEAPKTRNADVVSKADEKRDEELKKFAKDLEGIPESTVVVFVQTNPDKRKSFYKTLSQLAKVEIFSPLGGPALSQWVQSTLKSQGVLMDASTADYFISLVGNDLWRLSGECAKLGLLKSAGSISRDDIDAVVVPNPEANIFHFTDALSAKDYRKAIRNLHRTMAAGEDLRPLFYMIVRQFRLLLQVQSYKSQYPTANPTTLASALKLHPFVARTILGQISHFKFEELKKAYARLLVIDTDLKNSRIRVTNEDQDELALAVERFILELCV